MKWWIVAVAAGLLSGVFAAPARACLPVIIEIESFVWEPGAPVSFCISPDREARAFRRGGQAVAAELRCQVEVWTEWGDPHAAYVNLHMDGDVVLCGGEETIVPRDDDGWISVLPVLRGGGHRSPQEDDVVALWIPVCPNQILDLGREVYFNSPDLNGDLRVDLSDLAVFCRGFFGSYQYRCDFNWDDHVGLSDLAIMAQGYGGAFE